MSKQRRPRVVLGYSGLDGSQELKVRHFPGLDVRERRLFQGLDSAAAMMVDGELVAAVQQERFSGIKFDHAFPVDAIRFCLDAAGVDPHEVSAVGHGFDFSRARVFSQGDAYARMRYDQVYAPAVQNEHLMRLMPELASAGPVQPVDHHLAHALTAAIPSGFERCLVIVADGMGELNSLSVYAWEDATLRRLSRLDFRCSLGLFYALVTMHLGFWPNSDEYKVMALAASGDPARYRDLMNQAIMIGERGRFTVPLLTLNRDQRSRETFAASRTWLAEEGCPERAEGEDLQPYHFDLAAAAQRRLEQALFHVVAHWVATTGLRRVAFAGGVALNCVAIGKLAESSLVDAVYVQPASGDEGTSIGAALCLAGPTAVEKPYPPLTFLGPDVGSAPVGPRPYWSMPVAPGLAEEAAARLLAEGRIVGWAQGRLEFGPRALGNRSILADPRRRDMRDRVNAAVKFREGFRPLAPAVKDDVAHRFFEIPLAADVRHMTVAVKVKPDRRSTIPAVVHDDGTSRIQLVRRQEHPRFWRILDHFEQLTGVGVLMNTSLNVKGQPTARDATEAFRTFDTSALEIVFIGDRVYAKSEFVEQVRQAVGAVGSLRLSSWNARPGSQRNPAPLLREPPEGQTA